MRIVNLCYNQWRIIYFPGARTQGVEWFNLKRGAPANYFRLQRSCGMVMFSQPSVIHPPGRPPMATAADGMHPTGMHSCLIIFFHENCLNMRKNGPGASPALNTPVKREMNSCRMHTDRSTGQHTDRSTGHH